METKLDKLFDDLAEKEYGSKVDRQLKLNQKNENLTDNDRYVINEYYKHLNLNEDYQINEDNINEFILNKVSMENYYSKDKLRNLLLKR